MRLGKKAAATTAAGRSFENVLKSKAYFLSIGIWQLYTLLQYISTKKLHLKKNIPYIKAMFEKFSKPFSIKPSKNIRKKPI